MSLDKHSNWSFYCIKTIVYLYPHTANIFSSSFKLLAFLNAKRLIKSQIGADYRYEEKCRWDWFESKLCVGKQLCSIAQLEIKLYILCVDTFAFKQVNCE